MYSDFEKRRVVIYARVSTEHEAQLSALENQVDWYKPILAARPSWILVGQNIDEGITGTSAEKRPQFMQMIKDAKAGKFDMIITREVSRFVRNTVDTLQYTRALKDNKVEVFFINDNIKTFDGDGELRLTIMATLAQDESRKKRGLSLEGICQTPMIPEWKLQMMANTIFGSFLLDKQKVLDLANSILESHIGDTEKTEDNSAILQSKTDEYEKLSKRLDNYIEMRADGEITKEVFRAKTRDIEDRMEKLHSEIDSLSKESAEPEIVDYKEKITVLQYELEQYTHPNDGEDVPESVIEAFVEKIVASKDGFDWYLRFDGDPNDPLHCSTKGKRKTTMQISIAGVNSPAIHSGDTGED